jgi:predicted dehydrogenase
MRGIVIIGYGYWGPKLVRAFLQGGSFERVMVCDPVTEKRQRAVRENPGVTAVESLDVVLRDGDVEAVVIATPPGTHYGLARAALLAGKHVLVEKPLSICAAEAAELVDLAASRGRTLMVDHTYVYHPAVQKIRQLIGEGELGRLAYIDSTRINLGLFQHDVNVLWDLAVHDLAIINRLVTERPATVQAIGFSQTSSPLANIGVLMLRYESGLFVHINSSWVSPVKIRHMLFGGDRKMIVYDDLNANEPVKVYDSGFTARTDEERNRLLFEYRSGDVYSPRIPTREALAGVVADFAAAIRDGTAPLSDGRFGLDTVRILEAAEQSMGMGGREVSLIWK